MGLAVGNWSGRRALLQLLEVPLLCLQAVRLRRVVHAEKAEVSEAKDEELHGRLWKQEASRRPLFECKERLLAGAHIATGEVGLLGPLPKEARYIRGCCAKWPRVA